ncbi:phospholipase A [Ottowia thiooxydans]|uniref:phospholipase A n=1 Tax=Ottowia thiooxydans TaxID=219182 RepID=UPI0003FEA6C4|nr:phospholipase A [Ottowia thiooxydans]
MTSNVDTTPPRTLRLSRLAWAASLTVLHLNPAMVAAETPAAVDLTPRAASEATLAWQQCSGKPDTERLACFDDWARSQQLLLQAVQEKARSVAESPNLQATPGAASATLRQDVTRALASTQPSAPEAGSLTASAGIVGVGLEQGCRDRQFSEFSRFWELESGSSCPTFGLRAFHPTTVTLSAGNRINRQPTSPNPANSATSPIDYSTHELSLSLSVRTKLASGILTPAGGTLRDSLWVAYTQKSNWQVFNSTLSRPFRNTDHQPELIYIYPTTAKLPGGWLWRYTGLGVVHQSNGQSDPLSRSWNRAYLMTGIEKDNTWAVQLRLWKRFSESAAKDNNPDITRFLGHGDLNVRWNVSSQNSLRLTYAGFNRRGSGKLEWTRSLGDGLGNSFSGLKLYTSVFHGYGDTLLDYNFKRTVFNIGLSLSDF